MCRFVGIELSSGRIPYKTTNLVFRHLLEKHGLCEEVFDTVNPHLSALGIDVDPR